MLDRDQRRLSFHAAQPPSASALLHPLLSPAAAVIALWDQRSSLHASAVLHRGSAWGLLGTTGSGKSTMAATLVRAGCDFLTDDLLVVEGAQAFAGPPASDLRRDLGPGYGGVHLGLIGHRERWRVPQRHVAWTAELAGFVALEWGGDGVSVQRVGASARIERLLADTVFAVGSSLLDLATLPMLRLTRARDLPPAMAAEALLEEMD